MGNTENMSNRQGLDQRAENRKGYQWTSTQRENPSSEVNYSYENIY